MIGMGPIMAHHGGAAAAGYGADITSASFFGGQLIGYIKPGGVGAAGMGVSGGSMSGPLFPGLETDSIFYSPDAEAIFVYFVGDARTELTWVTALMIGGVSCAIIGSPYYDGDLTELQFTDSAVLVASTTQSLQLVE